MKLRLFIGMVLIGAFLGFNLYCGFVLFPLNVNPTDGAQHGSEPQNPVDANHSPGTDSPSNGVDLCCRDLVLIVTHRTQIAGPSGGSIFLENGNSLDSDPSTGGYRSSTNPFRSRHRQLTGSLRGFYFPSHPIHAPPVFT